MIQSIDRSFPASPARPASPMQIVANCHGKIIVYNILQERKVKPSRSQIGRQHNIHRFAIKLIDIGFPHGPTEIAMQACCWDFHLAEVVVELVKTLYCVAENQYWNSFVLHEKAVKGLVFVQGFAVDELVANILEVQVTVLVDNLLQFELLFGVGFVLNSIPLIVCVEPAIPLISFKAVSEKLINEFGECCTDQDNFGREHPFVCSFNLPNLHSLYELLEDIRIVGIEQRVELINYQIVEIAQEQMIPQLGDPVKCGDDYICPLIEHLPLLLLSPLPIQAQHLELAEVRNSLAHLCNLAHQLFRRDHDQAPGPIGLGEFCFGHLLLLLEGVENW